MKNDILKKLSSRRKMPGAKRLLILDRFKGSRDFKNSQICPAQGDALTSPWIREKARNLAVYKHYIYIETDRALREASDRVSILCEELEVLAKDPPSAAADNDESRDRMAALRASRAASADMRRREIAIELAAIRSELEVIDAALIHHLQRADSETEKHISAYWSGVLKAAASDEMPTAPFTDSGESKEATAYHHHFRVMTERIDTILEGGE